MTLIDGGYRVRIKWGWSWLFFWWVQKKTELGTFNKYEDAVECLKKHSLVYHKKEASMVDHFSKDGHAEYYMP